MANRKQKTASQDNPVVLSSGARLTIESIADFTRLVRDALDGAKSVAVAFESDLEVDITALQVLCSACKTAAAEGKSFSCSGPQPQALVDLIVAAGAEHHGACRSNNNNPCIWFGGTR